MIKIIGTSHISPESVSDAQELIEDLHPDLVAVELDPMRFNALRTGKQGYRLSNPFISLMQWLQNHLSKKTGIAPGSELLKAVESASENDIPVALIDQDIRVTVKKLRTISLTEKIKLLGFTLLGFMSPIDDTIDLETVPDQTLIQQLLIRLRISFPSLHRVLIQERNQIMAAKLIQLEQEFGNVLAFVGAGHVHGIQELLDRNTY